MDICKNTEVLMKTMGVPALQPDPGQARQWGRFQVLRPLWSAAWTLTLISVLSLPTLNANAASPLSPQDELEKSIWLADPAQLNDYEIQAARIVQEDPYSAWGHYLLAQLYLRQFKNSPSQLKLLKQAAELGQQAIDLAPSLDYGYVISAQVLDLMGYTENAITVLEGEGRKALKPSWRTHFLKGQLLNGQVPDNKVLAFFDQGIQTQGAIHDIVVPYLVATLQGSHQGEELTRQLQYWRKKQPHRLFDLSLAMAYADQKRYDEAHQIYAQLRSQHKNFREASINDAVLLYTYLNRQSEAETLLKQLIEEAHTLDAFKKSLVHAHMGKLLLSKTKRFEEARKHFVLAIGSAKNPMEWVSFSHKAYEQNQRLNDFIQVLEDLQEKIPGSSMLYALQGEVLSENLALHEEAVDSFNSAILLDPRRSEFYNGLGLAYYRMNKLESALKVFSQATRVDPQDATSRYNEACVLAVLGRSTEALGSLREAIDLDPRLQQTARHDKDFENIRESELFRSLTEPHSSAATKAP